MICPTCDAGDPTSVIAYGDCDCGDGELWEREQDAKAMLCQLCGDRPAAVKVRKNDSLYGQMGGAHGLLACAKCVSDRNDPHLQIIQLEGGNR